MFAIAIENGSHHFQFDLQPASTRWCSMTMAPDVVRCVRDGALGSQDQLQCNCPPSCHDTSFKVKKHFVVVDVAKELI